MYIFQLTLDHVLEVAELGVHDLVVVCFVLFCPLLTFVLIVQQPSLTVRTVQYLLCTEVGTFLIKLSRPQFRIVSIVEVLQYNPIQ